MCGIAGFYLKETAADVRVHAAHLEQCLPKMHHRGPDGRGTYLEGRIGLGHTRLSIIDLEGGKQPMANHDRSLWITYNGEVYNFPELRHELLNKNYHFQTRSDTEVILYLYQEYGIDCLQKLIGMFAFAIWDARKNRLFIARDRLGVKPLFYTETSNGLFFASEIQALLELSQVSRDINPSALRNYFTFQYIPGPATAFLHIEKLLPAHFLKIQKGHIERNQRYWLPKLAGQEGSGADSRISLLKGDSAGQGEPADRIPYSKLTQGESTSWGVTGLKPSHREARQGLIDLMRDAVKRRLISDVPLGAFLSGGIDSTIVVALMSEFCQEKVKTFSIGFDEESFNELPFAKLVAERFNTDHNELIVKPKSIEVLPELIIKLGEPMADPSLLPTYFVSKVTSEHVKVALSGEGGDEAFAGYKRYALCLSASLFQKWRLQPMWLILRRAALTGERLFNPRRRDKRFPSGLADEIMSVNDPLERYLKLITCFQEEEKNDLFTGTFLQMQAEEGRASEPVRGIFNDFGAADELSCLQFVDLNTTLPGYILYKVDTATMANSLECRSPFLDHRIMELALSLPWWYKVNILTREGKKILKASFKNKIPQEILKRKKAGFTPPISRWLQNELSAHLKEVLLDKGDDFSRIINAHKLENLIRLHQEKEGGLGKKMWSLLVLKLWFKLMKPGLW